MSPRGSIERSRAWHVAQRLMRLRQQVVPGVPRDDQGRIARVAAPLEEVRRAVEASSEVAKRSESDGRERIEHLPGGVPLRHSGPAPAPRSPDRPKVAVIAWDVGHNPLGRAHCLADILARRFDVVEVRHPLPWTMVLCRARSR